LAEANDQLDELVYVASRAVQEKIVTYAQDTIGNAEGARWPCSPDEDAVGPRLN
jgi:hypothetical protein